MEKDQIEHSVKISESHICKKKVNEIQETISRIENTTKGKKIQNNTRLIYEENEDIKEEQILT